jgi:hypothetical protein
MTSGWNGGGFDTDCAASSARKSGKWKSALWWSARTNTGSETG